MPLCDKQRENGIAVERELCNINKQLVLKVKNLVRQSFEDVAFSDHIEQTYTYLLTLYVFP
jgi:hypothetical protein